MIHLLERSLADVADPQVAGRPIEREAPRVAEPVGPDLAARLLAPAGSPDEGVVGRHGVRRAGGRPRIDPQELAEERVQALTVALRVAAGAPVARRDPEQAVGAHRERPAVVVGVGLLDPEEDPLGRRISAVGGGIGRRDLAHDGVPVAIGVVDEEPAVGREGGREGEPQEPALAAGRDSITEVEVRLGQQAPVAHHPDAARLLEDEQPAAAVAGVPGEEGIGEAVGDQLQADRRRRESPTRLRRATTMRAAQALASGRPEATGSRWAAWAPRGSVRRTRLRRGRGGARRRG